MILVLTPLSKEKEGLCSALTEMGWNPQIEKKGHQIGILFKEQAVSVFVGGHGKTQFGVQTQYLIHHLENVQSVLCIGAAGSLTKSVKPGDLVVATQTIEHDFNLKFLTRPLPAFPADPALLKKAMAISSSDFQIHSGPVASGDEDVIDSSRAEDLFQKTSALAVAWEGAGGARACHFNRIAFLEVRAVTDYADKNATTDFQTHLKIGMASAAQFLRHFAQP